MNSRIKPVTALTLKEAAEAAGVEKWSGVLTLVKHRKIQTLKYQGLHYVSAALPLKKIYDDNIELINRERLLYGQGRMY